MYRVHPNPYYRVHLRAGVWSSGLITVTGTGRNGFRTRAIIITYECIIFWRSYTVPGSICIPPIALWLNYHRVLCIILSPPCINQPCVYGCVCTYSWHARKASEWNHRNRLSNAVACAFPKRSAKTSRWNREVPILRSRFCRGTRGSSIAFRSSFNPRS